MNLSKRLKRNYGKKVVKKDNRSRLAKINSVQIIPENKAYKKNSAFKPGNLLINLDKIAMTIILRREDKKILWFHFYPSKSVHYSPYIKNR